MTYINPTPESGLFKEFKLQVLWEDFFCENFQLLDHLVFTKWFKFQFQLCEEWYLSDISFSVLPLDQILYSKYGGTSTGE